MFAQLGRQSVLSACRHGAPLSSRSAVLNAMTPMAAARRQTAAPSMSGTAGAHRALFLAPTAPRFAANPQSTKPASDNLQHMMQNVKEETKQVRSSIESAVSGARQSEVSNESELVSDAKSIIGEMTQRMPKPAIMWGTAGMIPYITTAGASIYLARQAQLVADGLDSHIDLETASALLLHAEHVQITFGAVLLSFLGAIHWGFEFSKYGGQMGNRRYVLGLVPVFFAWPTLLLEPQIALLGQWAAFVTAWFIDLRATSEGWAPKWYASYRFMLTLVVGISILATLAGTNYYNADVSRSSRVGVGKRLAARAEQSNEKAPELMQRRSEGRLGSVPTQGKVGGDIEATKQDKTGDSYVMIGNPVRKEQERKEKEEEEQKKKEEEEEEAKKDKEGGGEKKKDDDDDDE